MFLLGTGKKHGKYPDFCYQRQKHPKYRGVSFRGAKKHQYLRCFFAPRPERFKKNRGNTTYLTMFGHYRTEKKSARVTAATTTRRTKTRTTNNKQQQQ